MPRRGSPRTVVIAIAISLLIALAKAGAALVTRSAALWAETIHSVADSANEILLLIGLSRSARPADARHPFGHGQERYVWALLSAVGVFLVSGIASIADGARGLAEPGHLHVPAVGIVVLLVTAGLEGYSWVVVRRELRAGARSLGRSLTQHLHRTSELNAPIIYLEDSAALVGIALALAALILDIGTGQTLWDPAAGLAIGVLMIMVSIMLAARCIGLLIDESAPPDVVAPIRTVLTTAGWVTAVTRLDAVYIGPAQLLVIARVRADPALQRAPAADVLGLTEELRRELLRTPTVAEATITVEAPTGGAVYRPGGRSGAV